MLQWKHDVDELTERSRGEQSLHCQPLGGHEMGKGLPGRVDLQNSRRDVSGLFNAVVLLLRGPDEKGIGVTGMVRRCRRKDAGLEASLADRNGQKKRQLM